MIRNIIRKLTGKVSTGRSYFDYPAKEKKRIIKRALHESNKMQMEIVENYRKNYSSNKVIFD